jgi:hypothetical protein
MLYIIASTFRVLLCLVTPLRPRRLRMHERSAKSTSDSSWSRSRDRKCRRSHIPNPPGCQHGTHSMLRMTRTLLSARR